MDYQSISPAQVHATTQFLNRPPTFIVKIAGTAGFSEA